MKPLISVIIPVYNGEKTIIETLQSVIKQNYTDIEVIVVDDGSDNPAELLINQFITDERIKVFRTERSNANIARNYGILESKGEYIAMLDADDCWLENHLQDCISLLRESDAEGLYGSLFLRRSISDDIQSLPVFYAREPKEGESMVDYLLTTGYGAQTSTLFTTASSMKEILWDADLIDHQDYDFVVRFCKKHKMIVKKEPSVVYFLSSGRALHYETSIRFVEDNLKDINPAVYTRYNLNMYLKAISKDASGKFISYFQKEASKYKKCENTLVSLIVPIYNSELYLEKCLDSIINQTYSLLEIILVNDGSTDCSQEIINSYADKDERIVMLYQQNQGVSSARNAGLKIAKGEYILFIDSDDTIVNNAVEVLYNHAIATDSEIVISNGYICFPDGKQFLLYRNHNNLLLLSGENCFSQLMEDYIFTPLVYLHFTKLDFLQKNRLFFEEEIIHEDELWCIKTLITAKLVSVLDFVHYFYQQREGSLMHSDNKKYRVDSYFKVVNILESFVTQLQEKQEFEKVIGYVYVRLFYIYHEICKLLQEINEDTNKCRDYFKQLLKKTQPTLSFFQQQACSNYFINGNILLYTRNIGLTLSFCITCKNRLHQIKQTLRQNIEDNKGFRDLIEFILVDFGSTDGLQEWISENFMNEIEEGYLKYYYTEEMPFWHMSLAKNTSHLLANNLIVVNLDCDNFTGKNGGMFIIENMIKYGWDKTVIHQMSSEIGDGSCGRVSLSKTNFMILRGYDESFEPFGYDDIDLLERAKKIRLNNIYLPDIRYNRVILNTTEERMANINSKLSCEEMDERNKQLSIKNIAAGKFKANSDKDHIGIIDNIYTFD